MKLILGILFLLLHASVALEAKTEKFIGKAYDSKGNLVYTEKHTKVYKNGKIKKSETLYYQGQEEPVASLTSKYDLGPQYGEYEFVDKRLGYRDGASIENKKVILYRKEGSDSKKETSELELSDSQVIGQGFHHYIVQVFDRLMSGETIPVQLVFPGRLTQYDFRIRKIDHKDGIAVIKLDVDNWFFRLFAPSIECEYEIKTKRLMKYRGVSNLKNTDSRSKKLKPYKVKINYEY